MDKADHNETRDVARDTARATDAAVAILDSNTRYYAPPSNPLVHSGDNRPYRQRPHPLTGTHNLSLLADLTLADDPTRPNRATVRRWYGRARERAMAEMETRHDTSAYYAPPNTEEHGFYAGEGYNAAGRSFSEGVKQQQQTTSIISRSGKKRIRS